MVRHKPEVLVVDFHHARGPDIEFWLSPEGGSLAQHNDLDLLPFQALSDGAHAASEEFSWFTLPRKDGTDSPATSLFGMSCTRQINANRLRNRSAGVTRSTVQKAVVVLTDEPQYWGQFRERLSAVTNAWFAQEDFSDIEILKDFQESLQNGPVNSLDELDQLFGLSLREIVHEFRHQTLVLFKCLLLQRKMLFFGSRCEKLCMLQFSLVSLIPGLLRHLQDCAHPELDNYARTVKKATSLRTSDRNSLLAYMGLPLQIFGKGSFFGPYTPLQQLDLLAAYDTKSYVVGSTNSLLLQQKDKYSDILINLDEESSVTINSSSLRTALNLSAADRRWADFLVQNVNDTWDPDNPERPKNLGYAGSEEFIRLQFEEYLLALLSSVSSHEHHGTSFPLPPAAAAGETTTDGFRQPISPTVDPISDFNPDFVAAWQATINYALFSRLTADVLIYDIIPPSHPTAGGLSVEDIQRRLAQQVTDLHLDERMREGREMVNRGIASGRDRMNKFWAEVEARRIKSASRSRSKSKPRSSEDSTTRGQAATTTSVSSGLPTSSSSPPTDTPTGAGLSWAAIRDRASKIQTPEFQKPDTAAMQATAKENAAKAGAYLSSWGSWAKERGKEWQESRKGQPSGGPRGGEGMHLASAVTKEASKDAPAM